MYKAEDERNRIKQRLQLLNNPTPAARQLVVEDTRCGILLVQEAEESADPPKPRLQPTPLKMPVWAPGVC